MPFEFILCFRRAPLTANSSHSARCGQNNVSRDLHDIIETFSRASDRTEKNEEKKKNTLIYDRFRRIMGIMKRCSLQMGT